ncbi:MAG TPA: hypothetical protein VH114_09085 [Candidatus Acidoferrum sp.]|jgi:hypothetical protein|nr:hypothetical protein [Candidatus Acidoferrum sp.]
MTHLGVSVDRLTNLVTMQLKNDNTSQPFYFDRQAPAPFSIPTGFCFIITDVFVNPEITSFTGSQFYLVVVTADGGRSITVRCDGRTAHLRLTAGLIVPGPKTPSPGSKGLDARNTTFSTGPVEVQLLGYFEKEPVGPGVGKPFVP